MNFLAHIHLSGSDPGWMLGGILGDFARGNLLLGRFPEPVQQGIILHRKIDAFTDAHPEWRNSKSLLPPEMRKFAGIIIDVIYDHFLAQHWSNYSREPFDGWVTHAYRCLAEEIGKLIKQIDNPAEKLAEAADVIAIMTRQDWLRAYLDYDGIPSTLMRISRRSPRLAVMGDSEFEFLDSKSEFESHFLRFYPDLVSRAERLRAMHFPA